MAQDLELRLRINASASEAIRSLLETRRSLADLAAQTQATQARVAELATTQQAAQQRADELRVQHALASRELAELSQRVSRTSPEYRTLAAQVRQLAGELRTADREATSQTRAFESAQTQAAALASQMDDLRQSSHRAREALRSQGVDVSHLASEYLRLRQAEQQDAANRPLITDANRISQHYQDPNIERTRRLAELNAHLAAGRINQDTYNRALADYNRQAQSGVDNTNRLGSAIRTMGHIAASVFAANQAFSLGRDIYQTSVQFQRVDGLLKTVTGSAEAAKAQLAWLDEIANHLGLSVATTAQQYGFYAAAAKEAGFSQDETNRVFYNFTSAISGLQLGQAQAERVMYALTQMTTKPKVALEELQLQLGDSLPGVIKKAARAAGISTEELYDKISKGQLVSAEFIKAFSQVLADDFPALTEGAAQSAARLENAWVKAKLEFGKGGFTDAVAKSLDKLTESIDGQTPALKTWSAVLGDVITLLSAHGEEAGIGLSALLAGLRFGPIGAVVGGGMAAIGSAYVDSKKDAPDISLKPDDSADTLRKKVAGVNYLITQFTHSLFIDDDEQKNLITALNKQKEKLLAALGKAVNSEPTAKSQERFTFDPAKGISDGNSGKTAEAAQKVTKAQYDNELNAIKIRQDALKTAHDLDLKRLDNRLKAEQLGLKQQLDAEQINESAFRAQSLVLERQKNAEELALRKAFILQKNALDLAGLDAKINATKVESPTTLFATAEQKYHLPAGVLSAIAAQESGGDNNAVSPKGAVGNMQLMPDTAKRFGVTDRTDPVQSVEAAGKYLRILLDQFNGDIKLALAAYNAGEGRVAKSLDKANPKPLPGETQQYVPSVLAKMQKPANTDAAEAQAQNAKIAGLNADRVALEANKNAELEDLRLKAQAKGIEFDTTELENKRQLTEQEQALQNELNQAQHEAALADLGFKRQLADQELELGKITQDEHLQRLKELAAEELALQLKLLEDQRKLHLNDPVALAKISTEQQTLMLEFKGKIGDIDLTGLKNAKEAFKSFFEPLQNALDQSINGILTGQQTIANAARNAAQSIVVSYLQQSIKTRAIKVGDWLFEHTGMAKLFADKKQFDLLESVWDAALWARKRVAKTLQWAWEISGLAGVEARKKAINSAGELWDNVRWAGRKARLGAEWLWETLGFGAKEAEKTGVKAASKATQEAIDNESIIVQAASWLAETLGFTTKETTKTAVKTAANATQIAENVALGMSYAGVAGAAGTASAAAIPLVGWSIAPAAGAMDFAAAISFATVASAKGGEWQVDKDGAPYILHENESVLPAGVADNFRNVVEFVQQKGLKPVDVSAVVSGIVASGQLHGNWSLPASVTNLPQQAQATATETVRNGGLAQSLAGLHHLANTRPTVHHTEHHHRDGDIHFAVNAVDDGSVAKLLTRNGDTLGKILRTQAKGGRVPRTAL